MDESKEAGSELVIANGDSAELLEFEEELFHKMAFLVKPPIDVPRISLHILKGENTMKTKEELNALKEEVDTLNKKLAELNEEELEQVAGGNDDPSVKTIMKCGDCNYTYEWMGNYVGRYFTCPECGSWKFKGIELQPR